MTPTSAGGRRRRLRLATDTQHHRNKKQHARNVQPSHLGVRSITTDRLIASPQVPFSDHLYHSGKNRTIFCQYGVVKVRRLPMAGLRS